MRECNAKIMENARNQHRRSWRTDLRQCYTSCSMAKEHAYRYCLELFRQYNGTEFRIIGYNSMTFSVGFYGEINGKQAFFYITKSYDRFMYI